MGSTGTFRGQVRAASEVVLVLVAVTLLTGSLGLSEVGAVSSAEQVTIDFETLPDGTPTETGVPVTDQYGPGVEFVDDSWFYRPCDPVSDCEFVAHSGGMVVTNVQSLDERPANKLRLQFGEPQSTVSFNVAAQYSLQQIVVVALDENGHVVDSVTVPSTAVDRYTWRTVTLTDEADNSGRGIVVVTAYNGYENYQFGVFVDDLTFETSASSVVTDGRDGNGAGTDRGLLDWYFALSPEYQIGYLTVLVTLLSVVSGAVLKYIEIRRTRSQPADDS